MVPYLSISWKSSLWWLIYDGFRSFGGLFYVAIYLLGCVLFWMFLCQLFVMCRGFMWSILQHVIPAHIITVFVTTSQLFSIISIVYVLPIHCGQFAPLLVYFGYLLAISCYFNSEIISANFNSSLRCAASSAKNAFSYFSTTNNYNRNNLIFQPQPMELWTSLKMAFWHLLT